MQELLRRRVGDRTAVVIVTDRSDGDFHPKRVGMEQLGARQSLVTDLPWTMLDQVHGVRSHVVTKAADSPGVAAVGDILVTSYPDVPLAIWSADCAPLVMFGSGGTVVALHGGWKGLVEGVISEGVRAISARDEIVSLAALGPTIHACCYEFSERDLDLVALGLDLSNEEISGLTSAGQFALDVPAAVRGALSKHGVALDVSAGCSGCSGQWYSHRVRGDLPRHATVGWTEA